jgi:hypothetical protein
MTIKGCAKARAMPSWNFAGLGRLALGCAAPLGAQAQTFTSFDAPDAGSGKNQETEPIAINQRAKIVGSYMAKQRGYPDRRGMGAESDAISEQFVPSAYYKAQQQAIAQTLTAAGLNPEQIAVMLFVPLDFPPKKTLTR